MTEFTSVSDLLVSWGFQKYVDEFMRNEVDIIALGLLDDYQICTLIPSIGPQAKFKKALSDWKALQVPAGPSDLDDIDGFNAIISDYGDSLGGRTPSLTSPIGTPVVSPSTSLSVVSGVTSHLHRNLTTLLEKTQDGQLLLRRGQQPLGEQCRKILAREIGTQIVKSDPKASVTADTYIHWIQEIKRVFPAENSSIYYTGPPDGLRRSHGRLYDAVTNLKAKYRRNKIYQPRARRSLEKTIIPVLSTSTHQRPALVIEDLITASETTENTHEDLQECLEWLHSSADNYALCAEKWSKTSQQRLQRVLSEKETHSYLREFPGLSRSWGYTLLTADFHKWYPGNEDSFENKFPLLKNKLLSVSENISRKSSFVTKLRMLAVDPNPETSTLAVLLLIPHLLGPVHIKKKKSSAAEVRESFILHIEEERQLREEIQKRQEKYKALNITVQPFIVVVGALENITRHYLSEHSREQHHPVSTGVSGEFSTTNTELLVEGDTLPSLPSGGALSPEPPRSLVIPPIVSLPHIPLETALASLIATLYGSSNLPRNIVQIIVERLQSIASHSLVPLLGQLLQTMSNNGEILLNNSMENVISTISTAITSSFNIFSTEHRRFSFFQSCQTYIPPRQIVVGESRNSAVRGRQVVSSVSHTMQFIPLREVLFAFFSLESVLTDTLQYMTDVYKDVKLIRNFIQGNYWQSKRRVHTGENVVPLFLFFDDYETSNALGSHSGIHKLGAVYISVPCLPPWRCSALSNIFLTLLFHSSDRSHFGNNVIFQPVIDELNYLSTVGISFDVTNFNGVIFFELALIIGDNLGIHSITGFLESFSANYPCRICRIKKEDLKVQSYEIKTLLRCNVDYDADLSEGISANSGVKERCVWLKVDGFNLFKQVGVDVMHDILEGVGKYVMGLVLMKYITRFGYFSLELLNNRLSTFSYGPDLRNKPVELCINHISKGNIRLSASEMLTFIRYFAVLLGDKVPGGDSYWALYLMLREILELVMAMSVWNGLDAVLQVHVAELNEMYLLLSDDTLKPKFHYLTHYHNAMMNFGPLSLFSAMRYEAKHRLSKTSARASCNRQNITLSLAIKHQLKLNEIFSKGSLDPVLTWGPKKLKVMPSDLALIKSYLSLDITASLFRVRWGAMSSVRYNKGSILVYDPVPICDRNDITFLMVDNLYVYNESKFILTGTVLQTIIFDFHYYAYEVEHQVKKRIATFYKTLTFQTPHTLNTILSPSKKLFVTLRSPI